MLCMLKWFKKKIHLVLLKTKKNDLAGFIANINWAVNIRKVHWKKCGQILSNCPSSGRSEEELGIGLVWCCCLGKRLLFSSVSQLLWHVWEMTWWNPVVWCPAPAFVLAEIQEYFLFLNKEIKSFFPSTWISVRLDPKYFKQLCVKFQHELGQN